MNVTNPLNVHKFGAWIPITAELYRDAIDQHRHDPAQQQRMVRSAKATWPDRDWSMYDHLFTADPAT